MAELLLPRRAIHPSRRRHHASSAPVGRMHLGSSTAGTAAGRDGPPPSPDCCYSCLCGTATDGTSCTGRTARGARCPRSGSLRPQRNSDGGDFVEWVDGRAHPQGWSTPGFDDAGWAKATVLGPAGAAPFTALYPQRTRIQEHQVSPIRMHTLPSGAVVADFGAVYAARPLVKFDSGDPGRTVTGRVGYLLDADGQVSTLHGTQGTNLSFSYIMGEGSQVFEGFTYSGFRYLQVDNPGQSLAAGQLVAIARHAAMPDGPMATFSSANRMLDAVWRLNAHSCLYCSQEQFVDTPTREKGQFVWDASNESEGVMRAYGDQNLTWQGLRDVLRGQTAVLAGRSCQRRLPERRRGEVIRHVHRPLPRVAVALLRVDRRPVDGDPLLPVGEQGRHLALVGAPGWQRTVVRPRRPEQRRSGLWLRPHCCCGHREQRARGQRVQPRVTAGFGGRRLGGVRALAGPVRGARGCRQRDAAARRRGVRRRRPAERRAEQLRFAGGERPRPRVRRRARRRQRARWAHTSPASACISGRTMASSSSEA